MEKGLKDELMGFAYLAYRLAYWYYRKTTDNTFEEDSDKNLLDVGTPSFGTNISFNEVELVYYSLSLALSVMGIEVLQLSDLCLKIKELMIDRIAMSVHEQQESYMKEHDNILEFITTNYIHND